MQILVVGCGKVGSRFAKAVSEEGHDVVIVDSDAANFKLLGPDFKGITLMGVPIDQDVLKQAGIQQADALAAVTPEDNTNIMVCQIAKEIFKVPKVLARIYDPGREAVFHQFGLDTICPTNLSVNVVKSILLEEYDSTSFTIGGNNIGFKYTEIKRGEAGRKLADIKTNENFSVFGIIRNGKMILYKAKLRTRKEDILVTVHV